MSVVVKHICAVLISLLLIGRVDAFYFLNIGISQINFEQQSQEEKIKRTREQVLSLFTKAEAKDNTAISERLALYMHALQYLPGAIGDPLKVVYRGQTISLSTEIPLRLQHFLSAITLKTVPVNTSIKQGSQCNIPLRVTALFQDSTGTVTNIRGLPLRFSFIQGNGILTERVWTRDKGVAVSMLQRVQGMEAIQIVEVVVDMEAFLEDNSLQMPPIPFKRPGAFFQLQVVKRKACIDSREFNLERPVAIFSIESVIKDQIGKYGLEFVQQCNRAELIIDIEAQTRFGHRFQLIYFSYLDVTISIRDRDSNNEVAKTALSNIKGAGATYEQAGLKAYEKAGNQLDKEVLPKLFETLNQ